MPFRDFFIRFVLLIALAFMLWPGKALALAIDDIRFGVHPDKTRMVLELSYTTDFRVFTLTSPYRLVIDLPDFDWHVGTISKPPSTAVREIRQGNLKPGISRVVMDMEKPVAVSAAFVLPAVGGRPDRLVIDYNTVSETAFLAQKGRIHGTLDPDSAPVTSYQPEPATTAANTMAVPPRKPVKGEKPLIIIDPGHGGVDPGAIGANGVFEKHVTLAIAKELKKQLEASGRYRVKMTRDRDIYLKLYQRVDIARKHEGDLFISLHADSMGRKNVRGASVYTLSEKASDAETAKLAERENQVDLIAGVDLSHEDEEVATILVDLMVNETKNQSRFFANTLVTNIEAWGIRTLPNPHRYAGFAVLKAPDIPSVLIECGFMSNRSEADMLNKPAYRRKLASSLVQGIDAYFDRVHRHQKT